MKIKLYTWTELCKMRNEHIDGEYAYCIPKEVYQKLTKRLRRVIRDIGTSYFVNCSGTDGLFVPHSFVKEIVDED